MTRHKWDHIALEPKPVKSDSWWVGLSREEFAVELKRRHPDIVASPEGVKPQRLWKNNPS